MAASSPVHRPASLYASCPLPAPCSSAMHCAPRPCPCPCAGEEEPTTLAVIRQSALPPDIFPLRPTSKDQPKLRQFIYLAAPPPEKHTLPVDHDDVWYGTIPADAPLELRQT